MNTQATKESKPYDMGLLSRLKRAEKYDVEHGEYLDAGLLREAINRIEQLEQRYNILEEYNENRIK